MAKGLALLGEYGAVWLVIGVALALIDSDQRDQWLVARK